MSSRVMGCPEDRYKRASRRDSRRLHDDFLPRTGRSTGDSGISGDAGPIFARLLFGHDQRTDASPSGVQKTLIDKSLDRFSFLRLISK
jgi:hypothetical protein